MLKKGTIFLPWADVKGGGWVGLNINVKLTLTVAMWVWMRPLNKQKIITITKLDTTRKKNIKIEIIDIECQRILNAFTKLK